MENKAELGVEFLSDDPSQKDLLGGAFERIAEAIKKTICLMDNGSIIGLEGEWGSGKSTTINLLIDKLFPFSKTNVFPFYYDTWAHEGDPLRRTFLEKLTQRLVDEQIIDNFDDCWGGKKKELIGQKSTSSTKSYPSFTVFGKILLISVFFLVPLGIAFYTQGIRNNLGITGPNVNWYFIIGLIFAFSPIICVLGNVYYYLMNNFIFPNIQTKKKDSFSEAFAILSQKWISETTTETLITPNPTSVEFENYFHDIYESFTKKNGDKSKILLIIDNLDRISSTETLSILSTLQTFIQFNNSEKRFYQNLWVIIPYDPNGLQNRINKYLSSNSIKQEQTKDEKTSAEIIKNDEFMRDNSGSALSMIEKKFQIRFQIPPLVLSNWSDYFIENLQKAIHGKTEEDYLSVYRVYKHFFVTGSKSPTPRAIKVFINQICSVYLQWLDSGIPLHHIAYFVSLCKTLPCQDDIKNKLITGFVIEKELSYIFDDSLKKSLVSLLFNTEYKDAIQLLLSEEIKTSINTNNPTQLQNNYKDHPDGFWQVYNLVLSDKFFPGNQLLFGNAAACIYESKILERANNFYKNSTINILQRELMKIDSWSSITPQITDGIIFILDSHADLGLFIVVYNSLNHLSIGDKGNPTPITKDMITELELLADNNVSCIIRIISCITNNRQVDIKSLLCLSLANNYYAYIILVSSLYIYDKENKYTKFLVSQSEVDSVTKSFSELIDWDLFSLRYIGALIHLQLILPDFPMAEIIKSINHRLDREIPQNIKPLLEGMWLIGKKDDSAQQSIQTLAANGYLFNWINISLKQNNLSAIAWAVLWYIQSAVIIQSIPAVLDSMEGKDYLQKLLINPQENPELLKLLQMLLNTEIYWEALIDKSIAIPEIQLLSKQLILNELSQTSVSPYQVTSVVSKWGKFNSILKDNVSIDAFIKAIFPKKADKEVVASLPLKDEYIILHTALIRCGLLNKASIITLCKSLDLKTVEDYRTLFINEIAIMEFFENLLLVQEKPNLNGNFSEFLYELFQKINIGSIVLIVSTQKWKQIPFVLSISYRKILAKRIFDDLSSLPNVNPLVYEVFGDLLIETKTITKNGDYLRKFVTNNIVIKRDVNGLIWLEALVKNSPDLISKYPYLEDLIYFTDKLKSGIESGISDDASSHLQNINDLLQK